MPLVVDVDATVEKTKKAGELFQNLGIYEDVLASKLTRNIRAGKGK